MLLPYNTYSIGNVITPGVTQPSTTQPVGLFSSILGTINGLGSIFGTQGSSSGNLGGLGSILGIGGSTGGSALGGVVGSGSTALGGIFGTVAPIAGAFTALTGILKNTGFLGSNAGAVGINGNPIANSMNFMGINLNCLGSQAFTRQTYDSKKAEFESKIPILQQAQTTGDKETIISIATFFSVHYSRFLNYDMPNLKSPCSKEYCKACIEMSKSSLDTIVNAFGLVPDGNYTVFSHPHNVTYTRYKFPDNVQSQNLNLEGYQISKDEAQAILADNKALSEFSLMSNISITEAQGQLKNLIDGTGSLIYRDGKFIWSVSATNAPQTDYTNLLLIGGGIYLAGKFLKKK